MMDSTIKDPKTMPVSSSTPNTTGVESVSVLKKFTSGQKPGGSKDKLILVFLGVMIVLSGVVMGWLITRGGASKKVSETGKVVVGVGGEIEEAGVEDDESFPDTAEGMLVKGGKDDEGTHHLDRSDLGSGKDVYLYSLTVELGSFEGKRVQVWGKTVSSQKAGWLMDVGRVKVIKE